MSAPAAGWLPAELPARWTDGDLTFVPLTPALLRQDYAAVMRDIPMLRAWSGQDWPTADFALEANLADLQRHDREQQERVALTYSVLLDGVVQGCIYVQPFADALRSRGVDPPAGAPSADVAVRGWLHDRPADVLIAATLAFLGPPGFAFPRLWWQTNDHCPEQVAACTTLGLTDQVGAFPAHLRAGKAPTWLMCSRPRPGYMPR